MDALAVAIKNKKRKIEVKMTKARGDFKALGELKSEVDIQESLLQQLQESHRRMEEIQARQQDNKLDEQGLEGAAGSDISVSGTIDTSAGAKVANNELCVGNLLQYLGNKEDLLNCRLVSPLWNDEVVRLFTKTPEPYFKNFFGNCIYPVGFRCWNLLELAATSAGKKTLRNLHLLLEESEHPELFLNVVNISQQYMVKRFNATLINIPECGQILQQFGHHVKRLEIEDDKDFSALSKCLGQNGHCPNLEDLRLTVSVKCNEDLPFFMQPFARNIGSLKLKKLEILYNKEAVSTPTSIAGFLKVFDGFLSNSTGIEDLVIMPSVSCFQPIDKAITHRFIELLHTKGNMKNLKTFHLKGDFLDRFHALSLIKFGSNLKKLSLYASRSTTELERTTEERREELRKFLKIVGNTLESFSLSLSAKPSGFTLCDIPVMPKLKELDLSLSDSKSSKRTNSHVLKNCLGEFRLMPKLKELSFSVDSNLDEPKSFHFLKNLHALRKLDLGGVDLPRFDSMLESSVLTTTLPLVHKGLEELDVGENPCSPRMIENLSIIFPNLTRLEIEPKSGPGSSVEEHKSCLQQSLLFISKMKSLKELYIEFCNWECEELWVDLKEAFSNLKETPNLEELVLYGLQEDDFKANLVADSLPALMGTPKLRRIQFYIYYKEIEDIDEQVDLKEKLLELRDRFAEFKVRLELM